MKRESVLCSALATLVVGVIPLPLCAQLITVGPPVVERPGVDLAYQITYLDPGYPVPTAGALTTWSLWASGMETLSLQVYRPVAGGYQLIGQNLENVESLGLNTFAVPAADQIQVEAGDLLGFRYNGVAPNTKVISYSGGGGTARWCVWPDGGAWDVPVGEVIPASALSDWGEERVYSLAATIAAVPEPTSALAVGIFALGCFVGRRILRRRT